MKALTTFDIFKVLERSNCGECDLPTCMAFAALVYQRKRKLTDCPRLDPAVATRLTGQMAQQPVRDMTGDEALHDLKEKFAGTDLSPRAEPLGGWMVGDRLAFHCLGKVFAVDPEGELHSQCHQNPWLHVPMLSYILESPGRVPNGDWVRFAELDTAKSWIRFFEHSCEQTLQQLAEKDALLLLDILDLFAAEKDVEGFAADASFVLYPLPRIAFLFAYKKPEGDFPARFFVYLDRNADENLDPEHLFRLGRGLAEMFKTVARRHGLSL